MQNTDFSNQSLLPAKLLSDIYRKENADSALKYQDIYIAANDSMYSAKNIQQTQLMSTENELKQQELEIEKIKPNNNANKTSNTLYSAWVLSPSSFYF